MKIIFTLLSFVLLVPRTAGAQDPSASPAVGARVRIRALALGEGLRAARVVASTPDTLVVRPTGVRDFTVSIPRAEITRIEVPTGHQARKGRFALIGLVAGTVVGSVAGAASYSDPCVKDPAICAGWFYETRQSDAVAGGLAGAVLGALGGAVLGQLWQRETWTALPLTRSARLQLAPTRGHSGSRDGATLARFSIAVRWRE